MRATLLAAVAAVVMSTAAQAASFTFQTLDNPADPTFNQLLGINDNGVIAGYYGSGAAGHPNKGYTIGKPYTRYAGVNYPGSAQTQATGLNNAGVVSAFYANTNLGGGDQNFGYIAQKVGGTPLRTLVRDPNTGTGANQVTQVLGINNHNNAAGFYLDRAGVSHGFAFQLGANTYTEVTLKNALSLAATGINDNNMICGFFTNLGGAIMGGFVKAEGKGTTVQFAVPHAKVTQFLGVNNSGIAVGFYQDQNNLQHGLYFDAVTKAYQPVDNPLGPLGNVINGLNNKGQLVGFYIDAAGNFHGEIVTVGP